MVDFTCTTRQTAEKLADVLSTRKEVSFARARDPEYTDIKFHWVPADFPDERITEVLQRHYGEIRYSRILKDRRGKADGRRFYNVQTEKLKQKPIPATVRMNGWTFLVEYQSQLRQCSLCKEFGHIREECPNYSPIQNASIIDEIMQETERERSTSSGQQQSRETTANSRETADKRDNIDPADSADSDDNAEKTSTAQDGGFTIVKGRTRRKQKNWY